jgi:phytol kinase
MTLLSSQLFPFSAVNRRSPATSTTTNNNLFSCNKPTTTNNTVKFLYSPSILRSVRLDERFVTRFILPVNAQDLIHNTGATVGVLGGAYALVFAFDDLTRKNILNQVMVWFLQFISLICMHICTQFPRIDPFFTCFGSI